MFKSKIIGHWLEKKRLDVTKFIDVYVQLLHELFLQFIDVYVQLLHELFLQFFMKIIWNNNSKYN